MQPFPLVVWVAIHHAQGLPVTLLGFRRTVGERERQRFSVKKERVREPQAHPAHYAQRAIVIPRLHLRFAENHRDHAARLEQKRGHRDEGQDRQIGHCDSVGAAVYPLMAPRNTALELVLPSLSNSSSMVSTGESGLSTLRRIHTRLSSSLGRRSSSLRVPLLLMSMAGKTRLSTSLRSRWISMLPVPLNSSKITSSMRLPVSMSAVAMMVSDPPSSILRAAPKKRLGRCKALESTPPESTLPEGGTMVL